jgi:hypothetical protein
MMFEDSTFRTSRKATTLAVFTAATFVAGILARIVVDVVALVAIVWLVSPCFGVMAELSSPLAPLFPRSDAAVKLVIPPLNGSVAARQLRLLWTRR